MHRGAELLDTKCEPPPTISNPKNIQDPVNSNLSSAVLVCVAQWSNSKMNRNLQTNLTTNSHEKEARPTTRQMHYLFLFVAACPNVSLHITDIPVITGQQDSAMAIKQWRKQFIIFGICDYHQLFVQSVGCVVVVWCLYCQPMVAQGSVCYITRPGCVCQLGIGMCV